MSNTAQGRTPPPALRGPGRGPGGMAAGMPVQKPLTFGPSVRRLAGLLTPHRSSMVLVVLLGIASVVATVLGPNLLGRATNLIVAGSISATLPAGQTQQQIIDGLRASGDSARADFLSGLELHPGQGIDFGELGSVVLLVLGLYVLSAVFGLLQGLLLNRIVQQTAYRMRAQVEAKIHRLPLSYIDSMQRGELLSRVTNDMDNVSQTLQQTLSQFLTAVLTVVGVVVMMFITSPLLAVISLITIPLTVLVTALIAKRSQKLFVTQWATTGRLNARIEEDFTGHALVKVFGRRQQSAGEFATENEQLYRASFGAQFVSGIIMPAMMFIGNLIYVVIAVVGGLQVAMGAMSIGTVQAFIQYSRQFTQPLTQLGSMVNLLQSGVASAERVFELLDADEQSPDPVHPQSPPESGRGRLAFEDVSFRYTPDRPLIEHLSLVAEPGSTVAIVGPTGAGKTTLVNLIMRFYEIDSGRITLDGVDVATMTRDDLRSRTGMVLQDTWLFHGTIRENIAYGRPDATEEEILEAARATYVDRFVHSLPDGYDTVLDDDGSAVSAGEKQLLTIARAFLAQPSVLILDEATSSVDTRTEKHVQDAMSALRADRTSFVIAHRLSTIRDADLILVMDAGSIVEQGTHDELLAAGGAYHSLYMAQFTGAHDE